MNVKADLSNLPPAERDAGSPPVAEPEFVSALANKWFEQHVEAGNLHRATALDLPYRASYAALRCDRQLFYAMSGVERAVPNIADAYRMSLGTLVHAGLEDAIKAAFPNADFEVAVDLRKIGIEGSAHADIVTYLNKDKTEVDAVVEVKTVNGFGFKTMATDFKGPAEGPRSGHLLQAALSAMALDARRVVIAYLSMENLSPSMKRYTTSDIGRFAAEWHYHPDEYMPIAQAEIHRIKQITSWLTVENLIAPTTLHDSDIPAGAYISDPQRGGWLATTPDGQIKDSGKVWFCDYCDFRDRCLADQDRPSTTINL